MPEVDQAYSWGSPTYLSPQQKERCLSRREMVKYTYSHWRTIGPKVLPGLLAIKEDLAPPPGLPLVEVKEIRLGWG